MNLTFGDLGQIFDGPHATPERKSSGPYFLNIASLRSGRLDLDESDHVSEADFITWTRRVEPTLGDLLFSYETRLGEAALMPAGIRACLGRRMALLRPNKSRVHPRFLLYYYLSPAFQSLINQNTIHGATVNRISLSTVGSWPVTIPDVAEQRAIAEVLGALDDRIAANAKLVNASEALAYTIFDSLPPARTQPLTKLAGFINGKAFTKGATGTGRVVIRIAELNSGLGGSTVYNDIEVPEENLARPGDLLFAWSGSLTVRRWYRPEGIINQHIFKVIPRAPYPIWLVHQILLRRLADFQLIAADKATTMGHIQRRHLEEPVPVPTEEAAARLDPVMVTLWKMALSAEQETLVLAELRDTLLPQLMSGKLRVRDAKKQVGAVV